ncbi:hypothetical protein RND71_030714 [Anisodus tanguticus]|uniref:C2H2-type domain-containing protein n=1 Tax=Anisodus tanguticus TaxID=243964 RepID=A0AAE1V5R3_9SOLA|nr:hypothetical protein RND71_030714 [Anisodus tanguticus]
MRSNMRNNYYYSEEAFAEEYTRIIWPPRCYACSFCKREFRCAQALGGHMNVHRRDRARIKQSQNEALSQSQTKTISKPQKQSPAGCKSVIFSYSPAIKELACRKVSLAPPLGISMETMHSKRHKTNNMVSSSPMPCPMEDIDLELRLGHPPALKSSLKQLLTSP